MQHLSVYFDGSCGPRNPGGVAAYGFVIKNENEEVIHTGAGRVTRGRNATNNVAEFGALHAAMVAVTKLDPEAQVRFHGDSTLVITVMTGESQARKGKYYPYYQKAKTLAEPYIARKLWTFHWINRWMNHQADELAQHWRF